MIILFTYEMEQFPVLLLMCCLNLLVCGSFSTSAKMRTILQNCWNEKMCRYSDCSSWNKSDPVLLMPGIKGIGQFAGHAKICIKVMKTQKKVLGSENHVA